MSRIVLNHGSYTNLLQLQQISRALNATQNILSSGKKVNSALDNPSSYYAASALNNRAADLSALLDNMSQNIQTIKAANEGISSATSFLEQMTSVAEQALETLPSDGIVEIHAGMSASEISSLITDDSIVLLREDITINGTISITAKNVEFNGGGYTINFTGAGSATTKTQAAIEVTGENASAEFKNIKIEAGGDWAVGISSRNGAHVTIDNTYGINMTGENSYRISHRDELLYSGQYNTQAIVNDIGAEGLAATACDQFYMVSADEDWYLPSFGELLDVYGYDKSKIPASNGTTGAIGDNKATINNALNTLKSKGVTAAALTNNEYWSSSEDTKYNSWKLHMTNGSRGITSKNLNYYVRSFQLLEDVYNPLSGNTNAPQLGDVMYADKTWGDASNYDGTKTAIGVVVGVSDDQRDVTIMSLKDLKFSSATETGNFNPADPFNGSAAMTRWSTGSSLYKDISGLKNYGNYQVVSDQFKSEGSITVNNVASAASGSELVVSNSESREYNKIYEQYDNLVADSSYKGINLLKGDKMDVTFNEAGDHKLIVQGTDVSASAIGLNKAAWYTVYDVAQSLNEIKSAINTLRSVASELGNNNSIIQNRQDFTENLINVLTEGADNLTLADMDEEAADMLALQTRQQLAVNALSLATQAEQSVLRLF